MSIQAWKRALLHLVIGIAVILLLGWLLGRPLLVALFATLAYCGWHLFNIYRLDLWLHQHRHSSPPEGLGLWQQVYDRLYRMQRLQRRRKKRLVAILGEFQRATEALSDAAVVIDQNGRIRWMNTAAERLLDLRRKIDRGGLLTNLIRSPSFVNWLHSEDNEEKPAELASPADETRTLRVQMIPYGSDQRLVVARDITRELRADQMRRDFVANVSHELRTPLTVISGYLETVADEVPKDLARVFDQLRDQSQRMSHIVEDLLTLSQLDADAEAAPTETVDVPGLLRGLRQEALALSDRDHKMTFSIAEDVVLLGEINQLRSVFSNLISNAIRYTPPGGRIRVSWELTEKGAMFCVSDTGPGIATEHLARLTERFYRVAPDRSRRTGGTGLGLAIVKHVLSRHGTQLQVDSTVGKGSTFSVLFPGERTVEKQSNLQLTTLAG